MKILRQNTSMIREKKNRVVKSNDSHFEFKKNFKKIRDRDKIKFRRELERALFKPFLINDLDKIE